MRNSTAGYSRIICIAIIVLMLCSCLDRFVEKPTFILKDVSLTMNGMKELKALLTIEVRNPNRFSLHFESLEYRLSLDNREAARGRYAEPFQVPPASAKEVAVPLNIGFDDLGSHIKALIKGKGLPYRIQGTLHLKALWGSMSIPFNKEGKFNIKL